MTKINIDKIRNDHASWMVGLRVCPQPEGACINCQPRATVAAHHVPALIAEVERLRAVDADRIAQAIGDPGSVVGRKLGPSWGVGNPGYAPEEETVTRWSTRAVLAVLSGGA